MSEKRKYPSTELSTAQRELIARLVGPLEARGISRSVFRDILADAEMTVPKSSLDRWVRAHAVTGKIFTPEKASGAAPLLDDEQCEIAAGWVLSQNDSNQVVSLISFSKFCASAFGVELARTTAHDYLHALGFSSKVSQVKTCGFTVDVDALAKMMFEWKSERQRAGDLKGLLASVDFTFTGHRTDRRVTYAPAGGAQPRSSTAITRFTNCYCHRGLVRRCKPHTLRPFHVRWEIPARSGRAQDVGPREGQTRERSRTLRHRCETHHLYRSREE
jgi:transposase